MKLRALLLLVILLAGLGLAPEGRASAAIDSRLDNQTLQLASARLQRHSLRNVLQWLSHQPSVEAAETGANRQVLNIHFRDGTRGVLLPAWPGKRSLTARVARTELRPLSRSHAPGARALVLEPFASELGLGPTAGDPEVNQLRAAGFQVDQLYDTNVTVSVMASMAGYNVVYMHTHSDPFGAGDGVVATGQLANDDASVAQMLQNGTVVKVKVSGSDAIYYGITSAFLRMYEGQFPGNSLVFLNGCGLLKAPVFWQALAARGVSVMLSWDIEATSQDNYLGAAAFFAEMGQGMTVAGAIAAEQAAGYGTSNVNGQQAVLGYLGDGRITLRDAANPPARSTPTTVPTKPAPTVTRTATAATSTPTATATTVVAPLLTVQLKTRVKPGARQVIAVRSSPDTIIHILVKFPNGDQRLFITATDGAGRTSFAFLQHPSKITSRHRTAKVTVEALKESTVVSSKTLHYLIGWGPVDVSAEPRLQKVSHMVQIWVHTQARTQVNVVLRFPKKGQVKRLQGRTGPRGWVRLGYRIGHYLKSGHNHTVLVRAKARIANTDYLAESTFRIV